STSGDDDRTNTGLASADLAGFAGIPSAVSTPRPPTTAHVVELNRGPFVGSAAPIEERALAAGVPVLDVRSADAHAAGHLRGAINVPVSGNSFATRAGFVLDPDERVALHASSREEAERAARGLRSVGFLELEGYALDVDATETAHPVELDELEQLLEEDAVTVVDV